MRARARARLAERRAAARAPSGAGLRGGPCAPPLCSAGGGARPPSQQAAAAAATPTLPAGGLDFSSPVKKFFYDPLGSGRAYVNCVVSLTGFALVGGPARQDAPKAVEALKVRRARARARGRGGSVCRARRRACRSPARADPGRAAARRPAWQPTHQPAPHPPSTHPPPPQALNVPYLVSLPLVFQTTEEWLDSELGVHPVQVALQVRAVGRGAAGLAAAAGCMRACAPLRAPGCGLRAGSLRSCARGLGT